jgi:CheY-like chemotaxis protein
MGPASATPGGRRLVGEDDGDEEVTAETIVSPPPQPSTPPPPAAEPASSRAPSGSFTAARNTGRFPVPAPAADRPMGSTGPAVAHVLVVGPPALRDQVARALPEDGYEVVGDSDPENALRLARSSAPDAVVASASVVLDDDLAFVSRLRSDPLTDFVPVVAAVPGAAAADDEALARAGADALIAEPVAADALTAQLDRVTQGLTSPGSIPALGEATPREIAHRLSQEIERGLVDALEVGGSVKVPVGDGSEVLAAAWAAISRVRAHVARRSEGAVRYRDTAARGGPALLALLDDDADSGQPADEVGADPYVPPGVDPRLVDEVDLRGRRVLVADDDPSVLDFFAGLLEDAGCSVVRARDGQEALDAARRARPDVVLSDILMPRVDGLGVCREVRRDPALADVPVILISWKEDFLQRMRELQAGASGYLRKEASGARILAKVRQVLRPRARLETQLRAGSEVRGRLEGIGIVPLLRTVAGEWVDARVVVRDAFHLFEVDLRGGELADATRTAVDGNFARGARVLPQLLGSTAGRFTATKGRGSHRPTVAGSLDGTLRRAMTQLTSVVDAVSGTALPQAAQVRFDEDVVAALLQASPERTRQLVEWLEGDKGPRDLLMEGLVAPQVLESDLVDLARRGAIAEVQGPLGEDRIEAARVARERAAELAPTADRSLAGQHPAPLLASPEGSAAAGSERPPESGPASEPVDDQASTSAFSAEAVAAAEAESAPASVIPPRDAHPPAAAPLFSTPAHIPPAAPDTPEPFADPDGLSLRDDPTERSDVEDPPGPVVGEPAGEARDTIEELPGELSGSAAGASRPASGADAPERPRLLDAVDDEPTRVRPSWPGEKPAGSGPSELDPSLLVDESDGDEATPLARPTPEPSVIVADEDGLPPAVDPSAEVPTVHRRADPTQTVGEWSPMAPPSRVGASTPSVPPAAPGVGERPDASGLVATPGGPPSTASQSGLHRPITEDVDDDAPAVRSSGTRTVPEATPEPPVDAAAATIAAGGDASAEAVPSAPRTDPTPGTMEVTGREAAQDGLPTKSRSWIGYALLFATLFGVGFGAMTYSYPWVGPAVEPYVEWAVRPFVELFTGGGGGGGDRPLGDAPPPASEPATGGEGGEAPRGNAASAGETAPAGPSAGGGADGQPAPAAPTGGAPDAPGAEETSDGDGSPETPTGEPGEPEASSTTTTTTTASAPLDLGEQLAWGERQRQVTEAYPGEVGAEEGLLVIEAAGEPGSEGADEGAAASTGPLVRIADRRFGRPPARLALPEGRYEVVFEHGEDEVSYRWVHLAAGETRVVRAP